MVKTIKLYDHQDKQYGDLSNNYKYWMTIDKVKYPSVTNFIFSNMLVTPKLRRELQQLPNIKKLHVNFNDLLVKETNSLTQRAVETAYTAKIKNNQLLIDKLLGTGKSQIKYISDNQFLGMGIQGTGNNLVGKYLMQIRHQLRNSFKYQEEAKAQQDKDYTLYEAYLAQKALQNIISDGGDIKEYIGKSPGKIIDAIGRSEIMKGALDQDTVINILAKRNLIDQEVYLSVEYPTILAQIIRKNELGAMRKRQLGIRTMIIFEMYIDYMIEKNFPLLKPEQYAKARQQQLEKIGYKAYDEIAQRVVDLYDSDMLSERLSTNIDNQLLNVHIPKYREVEEAEAYILPTHDRATEATIPYSEPVGVPIEIYIRPQNEEQAEYTVFSPVDSTLKINIDGRIFPTISHYIIASLIASLPSVKNMTQAYKYLILPSDSPIPTFVAYDVLALTYQKLNHQEMGTRIEYYMQVGMNKKFEDRTLQDSLLLTGDSKLEWNDPYNNILGIGDKKNPGSNLVGKYLMKLREQFKGIRAAEDIEGLKVEDITTILEKDKFLHDWLQMRVSDMCNVIYTMKYNFDSKSNPQDSTGEQENSLSAALATATLDKVYQPCSHIYASAPQITAPVPRYFRLMVQICPGFREAEIDVVEVLWRRVAVIMYYLIEHTKNLTTYNIRSIIGSIEKLVTQGGPCIEVAPNPRDNCIISALINILTGIVQFNKAMGVESTLGKQDVETAASIILNKNVMGNIIPTKLDDTIEKRSYSDPLTGVVYNFREGRDDDEMTAEAWKAYTIGDVDMDDIRIKRATALKALSQYWKDRLATNQEVDVDALMDEALQQEDENEDSDDEMANELEAAMEKAPEVMVDIVEPGMENASLIDILRNMEGVKYPGKLATLLAGAVKTIKGYSMANRVKTNRINFFATQR